MGEASGRGTYEERRAAAIAKQARAIVDDQKRARMARIPDVLSRLAASHQIKMELIPPTATGERPTILVSGIDPAKAAAAAEVLQQRAHELGVNIVVAEEPPDCDVSLHGDLHDAPGGPPSSLPAQIVVADAQRHTRSSLGHRGTLAAAVGLAAMMSGGYGAAVVLDRENLPSPKPPKRRE